MTGKKTFMGIACGALIVLALGTGAAAAASNDDAQPTEAGDGKVTAGASTEAVKLSVTGKDGDETITEQMLMIKDENGEIKHSFDGENWTDGLPEGAELSDMEYIVPADEEGMEFHSTRISAAMPADGEEVGEFHVQEDENGIRYSTDGENWTTELPEGMEIEFNIEQ